VLDVGAGWLVIDRVVARRVSRGTLAAAAARRRLAWDWSAPRAGASAVVARSARASARKVCALGGGDRRRRLPLRRLARARRWCRVARVWSSDGAASFERGAFAAAAARRRLAWDWSAPRAGASAVVARSARASAREVCALGGGGRCNVMSLGLDT